MRKTFLPLFIFFLLAFNSFAQVQHDRIELNQNAAIEQNYAAGAAISVGQLLKLNGSTTVINGQTYAQVVPILTSDAGNFLGVADGTVASGSLVAVRINGQGQVLVDGACSIGNFLINSPTIAGSLHCNTTSGGQIGQALASIGGVGLIQAAITMGGEGNSGGGGGGGPPLGNNGDLQSKNGSNLAASHINDNGSVISTSEDTQLIGPNPSVDIRAYGARAVTVNTTGTGSGAALTVGSSSFVNGDGITIQGGGAAPTMGTPSAPTVATGETESETQPDAPIAAGATASSTYNYIIVARDAAGGITLPSTATQITNGPPTAASNCTASLGQTSCTISTLSLSGNTITVVTTANNGLVANAIVHITGTTNNAIFGGWFPVANITNGTTFTITTPYQFSSGTATATGGQLVYFVANKITWTAVSSNPWEYFICAKRPGDSSYNIIGTSFPTTTNYTALQFDDWGSTLSSNPVVPWFVTSAICTAGAASNDNFTTTVLSGGGTTSLTLKAALTSSVAGAAVRLDNVPALTAAAGAAFTANASVFIPTGNYVLNSQSAAFNKLNIIQQGDLTINDTLNLFTASNDTGQGSGSGQTAFGYKATPQITCNAYPCIAALGQNGGAFNFSNLTFNIPANGLGVMYDSGYAGGTLNYVNFVSTGGNNDNMGIGLLIRPGGSQYDLEHATFISGPSQVIDQTWTPYFYADYAANSCCGGAFGVGSIHMTSVIMNRRGYLRVAAGGGGADLLVLGGTRQGGITPQFAEQNTTGVIGVKIKIVDFNHDTESQAQLAVWGGFNSNSTISIEMPSSVSTDTGTTPSQVTGGNQFGQAPPVLTVAGVLTGDVGFAGFNYNGGNIFAVNSVTQLITPQAQSPRNVQVGVSPTGVPIMATQKQCLGNNGATTIATPYTIQSVDFACIENMTGSSAVTIPDAGSAGFLTNFNTSICNANALGGSSIPVNRSTTSVFTLLGQNGTFTTFQLQPGQCVYSYSPDNANWTISGLAPGSVGSGASPSMGAYFSNQCSQSNTALCIFTPANTQTAVACFWTAAATLVTCYTNETNMSGAVSSNVATYTITNAGAIPSNWVSGNTLVVSGFTGADTYLNQTCTISASPAPTQTTVSCPLTHANASSTTLGLLQNQSVGPFVAGDVGKRAYGYATCNAFSGDLVSNAASGAITVSTPYTISSFVNSISVNLSANPANAVSLSTQGGCFIWGTPDDTGAAALWTAISNLPYCPKVFLGSAQYMFTTPPTFLFGNPTACAQAGASYTFPQGNLFYSAGYEVEGRGRTNTLINITPGFPETGSCNHGTSLACFVRPLEGRWTDFQITGGQNSQGATGASLIEADGPGSIDNFTCTNWGGNHAGVNGMLAYYWEQWRQVDNSGCGSVGVVVEPGTLFTAYQLRVENNGNADVFLGGTTSVLYCHSCGFFFSQFTGVGVPQVGIFNEGGTVYLDQQSNFVGGTTSANQEIGYENAVNNGGILYAEDSSFQMNVGTNTNSSIVCTTTCTNYLRNTSLTSQASGNVYKDGAAGSRLFDQGGNTGWANGGGILLSGQILGSANSANQSPLVTGNLVLSANWGTSAATSAWVGGDFPNTFTITNGTAATGASPTIVYTFPVALPITPIACSAIQTGGTNAVGTFTSSALTNVHVTFTFSLTPTINSTETVEVKCDTY